MQNDIAVVGMACHVPGADNINAFWSMLTEGREGLRSLTSLELQTIHHQEKNYVAAGGFIDNIDLFDAAQFAFTAREAALMDPQHRLWLQACWQILEMTGNACNTQLNIGVFASSGPSYYLQHILANSNYSNQHQAALLGNAPDCLATRVSFALNLTGPSMTVQCGCSSSLVALHQARLALLARQCDAALAGGICLTVPNYQGYSYLEGGIASPDGHCRPFSNDAAGTVFANGYGVVLLKRLADALADGDTVYAVLKGSAINNDGSDKASFTAPSVNGQAAVIAKALRVANLKANDIQYIETHGTGTPIGDPIELTALQQAFKQSNVNMESTFSIGSVKANVGHLDVAAGIIGFIKTCLMLHHKKIPPQINFTDWNPTCLQAGDYFTVNKKLSPWLTQDKRRAGISAFGFGGTNAHAILEEAHDDYHAPIELPEVSQLIILSGKTIDKLLAWVKALHNHLQTHSTTLASLAYSLQIGRPQLPYRILFHAPSIEECIHTLARLSEQDIVACKVNPEVINITGNSIHQIQQRWLSGSTLNWKAYYSNLPIKKVVLPATPLQLNSYWIDGDKSKENTAPISKENYLYQSVWHEQVVLPTSSHPAFSPVLIIANNNTLANELMEYFEQQHINYIVVLSGENFKKINSTTYQLSFNEVKDYRQLENALDVEGRLPQTCLLTLETGDIKLDTDYPQAILFNLVKQAKLMRKLKVWATITVGMSRLHYAPHYPASAFFIGLTRGIGQEFPHIKSQCISLDPAESHLHTKQIIDSIRSNLNDVMIWRGEQCWQNSYQPYFNQPSAKPYFKLNGVYLITGGLGDVASVHVEFLAREYQARIVVIGRSKLPHQHTWDEALRDDHIDLKTKKKISRLKEWKNRGFNIYPYVADITKKDEMHLICQKIVEELGSIDGIIHIAGAPSETHYKPLIEIDWPHCHQLLHPKLTGLQVLNELANTFAIPNCLIISSISAALAGIGLSVYGALHNVLDACTMHYQPHWRIMNWDAWNFHQQHEKQYGELGAEIDKFAIKPETGLNILKQAFNSSAWHQLFISSADLIDRHQYWVRRGFLEKTAKTEAKHARPHLANEYVVPNTALQKKLTQIWQSLLGIEKVGIHDNFFELGGHSLLALELIANLQNDLNYTCSVIDLFDSATIYQLANKIDPSASSVTTTATTTDRAKKQLAALRKIQSKAKRYDHV